MRRIALLLFLFAAPIARAEGEPATVSVGLNVAQSTWNAVGGVMFGLT
jgi:hypothetical protein